MKHQPRVQLAAAGGHHQTVQRGHAHAVVDRAPVIDRRDRRAAAQVAGDDLQGVEVRPQMRARRAGRTLVRDPVRTEPAELRVAGQIRRQRVATGRRGHAQVKRGIEHRYLRYGRGDVLAGLDAAEIEGILHWRQVRQAGDLPLDRVIDERRPVVFQSAVADAMADDGQVLRRVERPARVGAKAPQHVDQRRLVRRRAGCGRCDRRLPAALRPPPGGPARGPPGDAEAPRDRAQAPGGRSSAASESAPPPNWSQ